MIFGYINGTNETIEIEEFFMDDYINSNKSLINFSVFICSDTDLT